MVAIKTFKLAQYKNVWLRLLPGILAYQYFGTFVINLLNFSLTYCNPRNLTRFFQKKNNFKM